MIFEAGVDDETLHMNAGEGGASAGPQSGGDRPEEAAGSAAPTRNASAAAPAGDRRLRLLVRWLILAAAIVFIVRVFVLEPFAIPTGSMRTTILEGDVVLVDKLPYAIRSPRTLPFTSIRLPTISLPGLGRLERGDVVVFEEPAGAGSNNEFVKRCAALPGDTVQIVAGRVRVNGVELPAVHGQDERSRRRSPIARSRILPLLRDGAAVRVPFEGYTIELDSVRAALWRQWIEAEGVTVSYRNRIVFIGGLPATRYTFKRDYFFALGDNSSVSRDSRVFGFVPCENLIGRAWLIYWSRDADTGVRCDRIGTVVR